MRRKSKKSLARYSYRKIVDLWVLVKVELRRLNFQIGGTLLSAKWQSLNCEEPSSRQYAMSVRIFWCWEIYCILRTQRVNPYSRSETFSYSRHNRSELLVAPNFNSAGGWDQDQVLISHYVLSSNLCYILSIWGLENTSPWNTV